MENNKFLSNNYQLFILILDNNKIIRLTNYPQGLSYSDNFYSFANISFNANIISNNSDSYLEMKIYFNENFSMQNNILSSKIEIIPIVISLTNQFDSFNISGNDFNISANKNISQNYKNEISISNYNQNADNTKLDVSASKPLFFNKCKQYIRKDNFIIIKAQLQYDFMNLAISRGLNKNCNSEFADARCKINLSQYTFNFIIEKIEQTNQILRVKNLENIVIENTVRDKFNKIKAMKTFENGYFLYKDQANNFISKILSYSSEDFNLKDNSNILIKKNSLHTIKLANNINNLVQFSIVQLTLGCNLSFDSCKNFNNAINFRGLPYLDAMKKRFE